MGSKGGTTVNPVNPYEVAQADAQFNRIDQFTPYGSLTFAGPNRNQANLQLNPALQGNLDRQMLSDTMLLDSALGRQQQFNQGGLPSLTTGLNTQGLPGLYGYNPAIGGQQTALRNPQGGFDPAPPNVNVPSTQQWGPYQQATSMAGLNSPQRLQSGAQTPKYDFSGMGSGQTGPAQSGPKTTPTIPGQAPVQSGPTAGAIPQFGGPTTTAQNAPSLSPQNYSRDSVENALFDRGSSLLNRQFNQDEDRLRQSLANRGLTGAGTTELGEAASTELGNFGNTKNQAFLDLANDAILQGGQEQSRLFGMDQAAGAFDLGAQQQQFNQGLDTFGAQNTSRQTGLNDIAFANQINSQVRDADLQAQLQQANLTQANRATQFNELASLLGLQQVAQPGLNNFFTPANADVGGAFGLNQQGQMANAQNATATKGGALGGLGNLGSAAIGAK
jgi:hypothetical protein